VLKSDFCLVLHSHIPFVYGHGSHPHGEHWLLEAMFEVYIPLLEVLDNTKDLDYQITLGMTPILLIQLANSNIQDAFDDYILQKQRQIAEHCKHKHFSETRLYWGEILKKRKALWLYWKRDLISAFCYYRDRGKISFLTSYANHAYGPLLMYDQTIERELQLGLQISEYYLGERPSGIWVPECAFAPQRMLWNPLENQKVLRKGIDRILEAHGIDHFFVEAHLVEKGKSEGVQQGDVFTKLSWEARSQFPQFCWGNTSQPTWVSSLGIGSDIAAFGRDAKISGQVWSAEMGYPGDGRYLEFHKSIDGLKYWRVTDRCFQLDQKKIYSPILARDVVRQHASHWCSLIMDEIAHFPKRSTITTCFDTELFGHWWHEGPQFLEQVIRILSQQNSIRVTSPKRVLQSHPPQTVMSLPEGSWGAKGNHSVWKNDQSHWMWDVIHRCEKHYLELEKRGLATTELKWYFSLLACSDWIFVISSKGAVDYGHHRFSYAYKRFSALAEMLELESKNQNIPKRIIVAVQEARAYQPIPSAIHRNESTSEKISLEKKTLQI
jgi:1,4-alpha-glucan branching enzyme